MSEILRGAVSMEMILYKVGVNAMEITARMEAFVLGGPSGGVCAFRQSREVFS